MNDAVRAWSNGRRWPADVHLGSHWSFPDAHCAKLLLLESGLIKLVPTDFGTTHVDPFFFEAFGFAESAGAA